jgi:hypothetical protein
LTTGNEGWKQGENGDGEENGERRTENGDGEENGEWKELDATKKSSS